MPTSYLKPISDYAAKMYSQGRALMTPEDEEAKAFQEKQDQIKAALTQQPVQAPPRMQSLVQHPADRVSPTARYGDRPGEQRIPTDNLGPKVHFAEENPQPHPAYDKGGDVQEDPAIAQVESNRQAAGLRSMAPRVTDETADTTSRLSRIHDLQSQPKQTPAISTDDGRHHMILAEEGERVLTPEQNKQYERSHPSARKTPMMANVYDEGGDVPPTAQEAGIGMRPAPDLAGSAATDVPTMSKPKQKKDTGPLIPVQQPAMIQDKPHTPTLGWAYDKGGDVQSDDNPDQDKIDPVIEAPDMREAPISHGTMSDRYEADENARETARRMTPRADTDQPKNEEEEHFTGKMGTDNGIAPVNNAPPKKGMPTISESSAVTPGMQRLSGSKPLVVQPEAPKPTGEPATAPDPMDIINQDKMSAMKSGDLVKLGMAKINERMIKPDKGSDLVAPTPEQPVLTPEKPAVLPAKQRTAAEHQEFQAKLKDYDQRIQTALDQGTPEGDRLAASIGLAKDHFQKLNPYGSEANHPGVVGKIEHGLAKAGNIAGNLVAAPEMTLIPGTELYKRAQETKLRGQEAEASKESLEAAQARQANAGSKLPPTTQVFDKLMTGGQNGGPQINPETNKPYNQTEALDAAQNPGKSGEVTWARKHMADNPGSTYEEGVADYYKMKAGSKPLNEHEKRIADFITSHNQEDTPANREKANEELEKVDTQVKQLAALPYAEQKTKFASDLTITRNKLQQANADAYTRGIEADKLQNVENARFDKVDNQIKLAQDALKASDTSQFAANIVPVITTLTTTTAEGVKRVNKQELDKFVPAEGSLGRWIAAHTDKWLAGEIPPQYKQEVGDFLDRLHSEADTEHTINSRSIDGTIRQGAQEPVQTPKGGAQATPKASTPKAPAAPAAAPTGETPFQKWQKEQKKTG